MTKEKLNEALSLQKRIDIIKNDINNLKKFLDAKNHPVVRIKTPNDSMLEYQLVGDTLKKIIDLLVAEEMGRLIRAQGEFDKL